MATPTKAMEARGAPGLPAEISKGEGAKASSLFLHIKIYSYICHLICAEMEGYDFNKIYERNYRRSFLFTKSYVHDDMVAEDIVAEALVKYWKLISSGETEVSDALLLTILKNKALDYLRHETVRQTALESLTELSRRELDFRISTLEACDPQEIFSAEIQTIIRQTLENLPEQSRRVFEMSRYENKTVKEIAEETGLTVKGVEYHITKSLKALRISLKDYLPLFYFFFY